MACVQMSRSQEVFWKLLAIDFKKENIFIFNVGNLAGVEIFLYI